MSDDTREPARPSPSSGRTTGTDWARLDEKTFSEKERELRDDIRGRSNGDVQ
jgi:hypothetical protein